ncbi:MAG: NUDIX hydrolase [Microthrixaceae bacterium]
MEEVAALICSSLSAVEDRVSDACRDLLYGSFMTWLGEENDQGVGRRMEWTVHGQRNVYESDWVTLSLVEVETPAGHRYEHHAISSFDAAGVLVSCPERGVMLMWRHRFLSNQWSFEVPGGMIEPGENPEEAARRECIEESGWSPGPMRLLQYFSPNAGQSTQRFWVFAAEGGEQVGPACSEEAEHVEWVSTQRLKQIVSENLVLDGLSAIAVLHHLASTH